MGFGLELVVDGKSVGHLIVSYSMRYEIRVLEAVFPKRHWSGWNPGAALWYLDTPEDKYQPPVFDFVGNEQKAKEAMHDYFDKTDSIYEDADRKADPRAKWEKTFWTIYKAGMALQKQGKEPRVNIG